MDAEETKGWTVPNSTFLAQPHTLFCGHSSFLCTFYAHHLFQTNSAADFLLGSIIWGTSRKLEDSRREKAFCFFALLAVPIGARAVMPQPALEDPGLPRHLTSHRRGDVNQLRAGTVLDLWVPYSAWPRAKLIAVSWLFYSGFILVKQIYKKNYLLDHF